MKYWEYDSKDLVKNKMYPLLPLQIFKLRIKMESIKRKKGNNDILIKEAQKIAESVAIESKILYDNKEIDLIDFDKIMISVDKIFI